MISKEQVKKAIEDQIIDGDGHTIVSSKYYTDAGFDCKHLEEEYSSNYPIHKDTIYKDGKVLGTCKGIHTLTFLKWVAGKVGLTSDDFGDYYGRKKSAQRTSWSAINLATGRDITIKSAAKLRGFAPSDWEQRLAEKRKAMGYK